MTDQPPLVSIVTPSFNKGAFIEQTILSVKNQSYPKMEHIVVDGGSTDQTLDILRRYTDQIVWKSEPDSGQSDAINKGWRMAGGEILAYLNADDVYLPGAVEAAVSYMAATPSVQLLYGDGTIIDEKGAVIRVERCPAFNLRSLIKCNTIFQPSAFMRRSALFGLDPRSPLDTALHYAMDYDLWLRIALRFPGSVAHVDAQLSLFRLCPGTKSVDDTECFLPELVTIYRNLLGNPDLPRGLRRFVRGNIPYTIAMQYLTQGRVSEARSYLLKLLATDPARCVFEDREVVPAILLSFFGNKRARSITAAKRAVLKKAYVARE